MEGSHVACTAVLLMTLIKRDGMAGTETYKERQWVVRALYLYNEKFPTSISLQPLRQRMC